MAITIRRANNVGTAVPLPRTGNPLAGAAQGIAAITQSIEQRETAQFEEAQRQRKQETRERLAKAKMTMLERATVGFRGIAESDDHTIAGERMRETITGAGQELAVQFEGEDEINTAARQDMDLFTRELSLRYGERGHELSRATARSEATEAISDANASMMNAIRVDPGNADIILQGAITSLIDFKGLFDDAELEEHIEALTQNALLSESQGLIEKAPTEALAQLKDPKGRFQDMAPNQLNAALSAAERGVEAQRKEAERQRAIAAAEQAAIRKQKSEMTHANLRVQVARGQASYEDINAALSRGEIDPGQAATLTIGLDKSLADAQEAAGAALADQQRMAGALSGDQPLDPKTKDDRDLVDTYWQGLVTQIPEDASPDVYNSLAADVATRTGIIPESVVKRTRGMLISGKPDDQVQAADTIARLYDAAPMAAEERYGSTYLQRAQSISSLVATGSDPAKAIEYVTQQMAPQNEAVTKMRREKAADLMTPEKAADQVRNALDPSWWVFNAPDVDLNTGPGSQVAADYMTQFNSHYAAIGDEELAKDLAAKAISRVYGVTNVDGANRVMQHAPETAYPAFNDSYDWITDQLAEDLTAAGLLESPELGDRVRIFADSRTAREASTGSPSYGVMIRDGDGVFQVFRHTDGTPRYWRPDVQKQRGVAIDDGRSGRKEQQQAQKDAAEMLTTMQQPGMQ